MTRLNAFGNEMTENILKGCSELLPPVMVFGCFKCLYGISVKTHILPNMFAYVPGVLWQTYPVVSWGFYRKTQF